ncbi:MAG: hypothetical protein QM729_21445 [Solirubrobacterales bacterium]
MLALIAGLVLAQPNVKPLRPNAWPQSLTYENGTYIRPREFRSDGRYSRVTNSGAANFASFEFAPANGTGMGSECACTTPTGAKGETMTFTRASAATCTKGTNGLRTTGIANGDLVQCTTNQPRVERDANGVLGLLVESSRTNVLLRSEELDNAAWTASGATVTANTQTAPDGTVSMDTIANSGAAAGSVSQTVSVASGSPVTMACYLKAGTITSANLIVDGTSCNFTSLSGTVATRGVCAKAAASSASIVVSVQVGGSVAANSIIAWGCDVASNASYATAYIPTTSAAVTRADESASFASVSMNTSPLSMAQSWTLESNVYSASNGFPASFLLNGGGQTGLYFEPAIPGIVCLYRSGTPQDSLNTTPIPGAPGTVRSWCDYDVTNATPSLLVQGSWNGTAMSDRNTTSSTSTTATPVFYSNQFFPIIYSQLCLDPTLGRCR